MNDIYQPVGVPVITIIKDGQTLQYFVLLSLSVYQYLLTLDDEVKYLWSKRMSIQKLVFLTNRYLPIVTSVIFALLLFIPLADIRVPRPCLLLIFVVEFVVYINIAIATAILTLRLMIIWIHNKPIKILLIIISTVESMTAIIIFIININRNLRRAPNNILSKVLCVPMDSIDWSSFIVLICGESIFISLVTYKKLMTHKHERGRLLKTLINDGIIYYIYALSLALVVVILSYIFKFRLLAIGLLAVDAILHSVISMHLSFRLCSASEETRMVVGSPDSLQLA
ncbi:hypothetical protein PNOK_0870400 [Pyrrhoderma noxium]|uniref:DUF6533 domain-containing protein n=1 Tax=Pyrrhoderma noxium TaxID=2282107 RepID=A0A286U8G0_9AGAM|nr:hypothetical protein PNOK_0870400 [Pyrrhoderma noxium]